MHILHTSNYQPQVLYFTSHYGSNIPTQLKYILSVSQCLKLPALSLLRLTAHKSQEPNMEDQFGGRTDDDLFADDFEPVADAHLISAAVAPGLQHVSALQTQVANPPATSTPVASRQWTQATDARISEVVASPAGPAASHQGHYAGHGVPFRSAALEQPIQKSMRNSHYPPNDHVGRQREQEAKPREGRTQTPSRNKKHTKRGSCDNDSYSNSSNSNKSPSTGKPEQPAPTAGSRPNVGKPASATMPDPISRLASGGAPRTKLTEEELAAKMERMRVISEERERRHKATEQDEKAHAEALARGNEETRKKRAEEAERRCRAEEERKQLSDERERNRARKLKAMGMKEGGWDQGKDEIMRDMERPRRSFRGAYGGVRASRGMGLSGSRFATPFAQANEEPEEEAPQAEKEFFAPHGRGKGYRGRGRGRGRGRFEQNNGRDTSSHHQYGDAPWEELQKRESEKLKLDSDDFPALPTAPKPDQKAQPAIPKFSGLAPLSTLGPLGKWDDDVEAFEEAAKLATAGAH